MNKLTLAVAGLLTLGLSSHALADQYEDAIKYRKAAFTLIKGNFGPMGAMVEGKAPFNKDTFAVHAARVEALSRMPWDGFIADSDMGETKAKPEVWSKANEFKAEARKFEEAAAKLAAAAKGGDEGAMKAAFAATGKSCKSCHDNFKNK